MAIKKEYQTKLVQKAAGRQHCHCEWKLEKKETIEEKLDAAAQWQTHQENKIKF